MKKGADIKIVLDSVEQAEIAAAKGRVLNVSFCALIELDSDGHRSGVKSNDPLLLDIGRYLHGEQGTELGGVLTHAGESYNCDTTESIKKIAEQEKAAAVKCSEILLRNGLPCPIVSIGSTPTITFANDFSGITEVRTGVYMFQDLVMATLGVCKLDDLALSVLACVIGHQKDKGWIITDAGWMALSRDQGKTPERLDYGYGIVCDVHGQRHGNMVVSGANQEHGIVVTTDGTQPSFEEFPIGTYIRILPRHACAMAAMHDRYNVVKGSTDIIDQWYRCNGW
jgi:D-serine deaminase-like pyridoxal phosphate-dependent protein